MAGVFRLTVPPETKMAFSPPVVLEYFLFSSVVSEVKVVAPV